METASARPLRPRASSARFCRKLYELGGQTGLTGAADVVHQLVRQDQGRTGREEGPDLLAARCHPLGVVLSYGGEGLGVPQLPGDLTPGRAA